MRNGGRSDNMKEEGKKGHKGRHLNKIKKVPVRDVELSPSSSPVGKWSWSGPSVNCSILTDCIHI